MEEHPPTDCVVCWEFLFWSEKKQKYLDEDGGSECYWVYPPQPHRPKLWEEEKQASARQDR